MPINNEWYDDEKTITVTTISDPFTVDDLMEGLEAKYALMDTVDYPIDSVYLAKFKRIPTGFLSNFRKLGAIPKHPRRNVTIVVMNSSISKIMIQIFSQSLEKQIVANTLEQAVDMIMSQREVHEEG